MTSNDRYFVFCPTADVDAVIAATSFNITSPVYYITDNPRVQIGCMAATSFNETQATAVDSIIANNTFPNSTFVKYNARTQRNVPIDTMASLGITQSNGSI